MHNTLSFQDIILRLTEFWQKHGCLVWHPYNVQVGAGTMNPATALRVLGPEPWNVVYVEPSIRPDDGRFGENPNRMQWFYQMQVILKPDPGNSQELYLQSLEAIGIDQEQHDIRFVEDNWESPALGAWGLGWEVWLDGQEITQFTYFQQAGGQNLEPVSVEITYGLERIALVLQGVENVWQIDYGAGVPYGDLLLQNEIEHCRYYFEVADVDALKMVYDTYENEAKRCLAAGLVIPAHDYNLKCSHLFNVLDTRGAIGVTERANYFRRMRALSRQVSEMFLEQRLRKEYPLLENKQWEAASDKEQVAGSRWQVAGGTTQPLTSTPQPLLLEVGTEELPAGDLTAALAQLRVSVPELLRQLRLEHGEIVVDGTPRRLAVYVERVAGRQTDLATEVKGPPADRAFDVTGAPTQAALGFARSKGVSPQELTVMEEGGRRYVAAVVRQAGRPAVEALAEALPGLIGGIKFDKVMRWNQTNVAFSRPVRWLLAMFGEQIIPFTYAGVLSDCGTRGLRADGWTEAFLPQAGNYLSVMDGLGITLRVEERRMMIRREVDQLAAEVGGFVPDDPALLDEVANLVERPTVLRGRFDERFLRLPPEVLVAVMKKHQRYFPVYKHRLSSETADVLLPYFIAVRNGDEQYLDVVTAGNEHVLRARFADAEFFYNKDTRRPLADFLPRLGTLTFQAKLGSMLDKARRVEKLTGEVARLLALSGEETAVAQRAAALAKADLATSLVVEMTSLQGILGGHYARLSGEPAAVAAAIAEQYQAVSRTRPGLALALADRLDSLVGLFAVGLAPKGSNDPFALRRAAIQIVENLLANQVELDLRPALEAAEVLLITEGTRPAVPSAPLVPSAPMTVLDFITGRLEVVLQERDYRTSVVRAALAEQSHNPYAAARATAALSEVVTLDEWPALLDAYARCVRITRSQPESYELRPAAFHLPAEKALLAAYQQAAAVRDGTVANFVAILREMRPAISDFFDRVLVMDEDAAVRQNRLALLQHIAGLAHGIADLSQLEGF
ncbi:MAG: glycine--tRNA ligase subunit beta [Chloroflexota bacterium]